MIWQTKKWQNMLEKSKQVEKTICIKDNEVQVFVEKRRIRFGEMGLFVLGVSPENISKALIHKLKSLCQEENALFLQIETFSYTGSTCLNDSEFIHTHFKNFITPFTAVIDLGESKEDIFKNMKPKGRYNIRLAEKKGVEVQVVEKTVKNIQIFTDLIIQTAQRDNFMMNSGEEYYKTFLEELDTSELIFAYKEGKVISAGIFTFEEQIALYYYGASSSEKKYRNLMAPYLVQWKAIKLGKSKGCVLYDFLGVSAPDEKNDNLKGVTDFKLKFTKDIRKVSENYVFIHKKWKYEIMNVLRKLQKKLQK